MEYNKLVAVSGLPGLYELISTKKDGAIVRSLEDKTTKFAATRIHQFSHLESIEIYTTGENVNLVDVFKAMEANTTALPDTKDDKAIKAYFANVYPELDFDRVYISDMRKMVKWFDILTKNHIEIKLSELQAEAAAAVEADTTENEKPATEKKPAKKVSKKDKEAPIENEDVKADDEKSEKAPKKAAAKKAAPKKKAE